MENWRLTLVLGTGGSCCWDDEVATSAAVYRFDPAWLEWAQVGELQQPRSYHGMGVVSVVDMQHYCIDST